jgi:hypothetical protein
MSNVAHFFNLNCFLETEQKAWIVDKRNPNMPIMKINTSDFKLIKSGIYRKKGNRIDFNDVTYYLPDDMWNKLKIISSKSGINLSNYVISLQEFLNKDLIDDLNIDINLKSILPLKNKMEDIYVVCSEQTKNNYDKIIKKIEDELSQVGLVIKNFYYLNDSFLDQNNDDNQFKKMRLILQHSLGYKSDGDKFIDEEITKYEKINFYEKSQSLQFLKSQILGQMNYMISNTERGLSDTIKDDLKYEPPIVHFHSILENDNNPLISSEIKLVSKYVVKKFESFTNSKLFP